MDFIYIVLAFLAGACGPTQAGINAQLRLWTGDPVFAAMISFVVGSLVLIVYVLLLRLPWPNLMTAGELPLWIWTGGFLGAFLVAVSIILAPVLGATAMMAFMIAGQLFVGLFLDNYGLLGFQEHPVNPWRIVGIVLVIIGAALVKRF